MAEAAAPTTEEVPFEKLKPVARPDENELKEKIEEINVKITSLQSRLAAIKENLDSREQGRGDTPEVQMNKTRMSESKAEARRLAQERRNIYDQINAADALKKQQQARSCRCCSPAQPRAATAPHGLRPATASTQLGRCACKAPGAQPEEWTGRCHVASLPSV